MVLWAEFGGRISSILLNVPGDAGAVFATKEHLEKEIKRSGYYRISE
ncbi:hypothetical protein [Campylobacter fetus]|nr:hypothetical protein [Campylobacter fetus]